MRKYLVLEFYEGTTKSCIGTHINADNAEQALGFYKTNCTPGIENAIVAVSLPEGWDVPESLEMAGTVIQK